MKHLYKNSPLHYELIIENIKNNLNPLYGFNLLEGKYSENMIEDGIIDSLNTIKTAVTDAVSVSSLLITTECVVYKEVDYDRKFFFIFSSTSCCF